MLQPENSWAGCIALLGVCVCVFPRHSLYRQPLMQIHVHLCQYVIYSLFYLPIEICWFCSTFHMRITFDWCWPWVSCREETSHEWDYHVDLGEVRASGLACIMLGPCSVQDPWGLGEERCRSLLHSKGRHLTLFSMCWEKEHIISRGVNYLGDCLAPFPWSHMALCRSITHMSMTSILETTYWFALWPTHLPERWEARAQGGNITPGCTLSLRDVGTEKPLMAQGALLLLLCGLVLPKVLPTDLQRWWCKERKRENKLMKRLRESSQMTLWQMLSHKLQIDIWFGVGGDYSNKQKKNYDIY